MSYGHIFSLYFVFLRVRWYLDFIFFDVKKSVVCFLTAIYVTYTVVLTCTPSMIVPKSSITKIFTLCFFPFSSIPFFASYAKVINSDSQFTHLLNSSTDSLKLFSNKYHWYLIIIVSCIFLSSCWYIKPDCMSSMSFFLMFIIAISNKSKNLFSSLLCPPYFLSNLSLAFSYASFESLYPSTASRASHLKYCLNCKNLYSSLVFVLSMHSVNAVFQNGLSSLFPEKIGIWTLFYLSTKIFVYLFLFTVCFFF